MPKRNQIPSYRLHKQSGQAVVTLTDPSGQRKDVLLGQHDTSESRTAYDRVIAEWIANGRRFPGRADPDKEVSVNEVLLGYTLFAEGYYVKNGQPTKQLERVKRSLRFVKELYGLTPAREFGPLALKAVREKIIAAGWTRTHINSCVGCIKRCFKWAVENELVSPTVYQGLTCVGGLKKGRSLAREGQKVVPVADEHVEATVPFLMPPVQAMVQLQRLAGMRPGEVVLMRPCDIDRSKAEVWVYRPESHKAEHHDTERVVVLGPHAQDVIKPFLFRDPGKYLFSPREAMAHFRAEQRQNRKSKVQPSQLDRSKRRPRKGPGDRYRVDSYGQAVARSILKANTARACKECKERAPAERCAQCQANAIPHWHPHQLRHTHATEVRRYFGLEGAQVALGHASAEVTQIYAERDLALAERIAREIG